MLVEDTQDDDGEPVAKRQKITIAEVTAEGGHSTVNQELSQDQSIKVNTVLALLNS